MTVEELSAFAIFLAFVFGIISRYLIDNIKFHYHKLKFHIENNREFKKRKKEMEEMRERGDLHEWVNLPTFQGMKLVCKKTGWCPEINGFFPVKIIERHLMNEEIRKQTEEKYEKFKVEKIKKVSDNYNLDENLIRGIMEKAFEIKKEFGLKLIEEREAEMERQIEETRRRISKDNMEEN